MRDFRIQMLYKAFIMTEIYHQSSPSPIYRTGIDLVCMSLSVPVYAGVCVSVSVCVCVFVSACVCIEDDKISNKALVVALSYAHGLRA